MVRPQTPLEPPATLESVREQLWCALPSNVERRAALAAEAEETPAEETPAELSALTTVPASELRAAAECLFLACHRNPVAADVAEGVAALLGPPVDGEETRDGLCALLDTAVERWLLWADAQQTWRAVSEERRVSVLRDVVWCVTQDAPPGALLPPSQVLTVQPDIARPRSLVTPFEAFVEFATPEEFPEIYHTLWRTALPSDAITLDELPFTRFFSWFYHHVFANATEAGAAVAAAGVWRNFLDSDGVMPMRGFVAACRYMCVAYAGCDVNDTISQLESFHHITMASIDATSAKSSASPSVNSFFACRTHPSSEDKRILDTPEALYVREEMDETRRIAQRLAKEGGTNRIIISGRRGVGKSNVARALAKRLHCVHLRLDELAMTAMAQLSDPIGAELRELVAANKVIPTTLRVDLLRREITDDNTVYRGYVLSELPFDQNASDANKEEMECIMMELFAGSLPTALVHVSCDDDFYLDCLAAATAAHAEAVDREAELRSAAAQALERAAAKTEARRVAVERYEALLANPDTAPEVLTEAAAAATTAEADEEEKERQLEKEKEAKSVAEEILLLSVRRLLSYPFPSGEQPSADVPLGDVGTRLVASGRRVEFDCTSKPDEAAAYVTDVLQLQPCILPRDLPLDEEEGEEDAKKGMTNVVVDDGSTLERDMAKARSAEEEATAMGAVACERWKRYCPVTFADSGVLVEGTPRYACVYRQRLYCTASSKCLRRFRANPPRYLSATPLDCAPLLLLTTYDMMDVPAPAGLVDDLVSVLFNRLRLTPMTFDNFVALWSRHRDLHEQRAESQRGRELYEVTERKLRADRLKKRLAAELKARKKKKKPAPPRGKGKRKSTIIEKPPVEEPYTAWDKLPDPPETLAIRIQKEIDNKLERRRTLVPVLVHASGRDFTLSDFSQLLTESVLPETVVVLDFARPEEEEEEEGEGVDNEGGRNPSPDQADPTYDNKEDTEENRNVRGRKKPPVPQVAALAELERRAEDPEAKQKFHIHRFDINDKDVHILAGEVLQVICPAMAPVQEGVVDEALGEDDGDEEEEEEDDLDMGDDFAAEQEDIPAPPRAPVDPEVRPGKRFLNQFGSLLNYCPVTYAEKGLLVRGNNEICTEYRQSLYIFTSDEARTKFERNPLRYVSPSSLIPPRVWIVGFSRSGKKTLAQCLQKKYGVPCFAYDRGFFERCVAAAHTHGGAVVDGFTIPESCGPNKYLALAEEVLKGVRDFAAEQERCLQLRSEAEAEMERRRLAEERAENAEDEEEEDDEDEERDEEEEARLQEHLEFEPEEDEDRELRLSEAYLKVASYVTRIEPFESSGYIMICPPFSDGDIEVLFSAGGIPEVTLQMELSSEAYLSRNSAHIASRPKRSSALGKSEISSQDGAISGRGGEKVGESAAWTLSEQRAERELRKWRRRHIGVDDPDSEPENDNEGDNDVTENAERDDANQENREAAMRALLEADLGVEQEAITEFADAIADRLVPIITLNGDLSKNAVFRAAERRLFKVLKHRRSLLHVAEICRYEDALRKLETGEVDLSYFDLKDPVALYDARRGVHRLCKWRPDPPHTLSLEPEEEEEKKVIEKGKTGNAGTAKTADDDDDDVDNDDDDDDGEEREAAERSPPSDTSVGDRGSMRSEGQSINGLKDDNDDEDEDEDEEMSEHGTEEMEDVRAVLDRLSRRAMLRRAPRVALFCGRLYFFDSDAALIRFFRDPLCFALEPPPLPPLSARPVIAILNGGDFSVAEHDAKNEGQEEVERETEVQTEMEEAEEAEHHLGRSLAEHLAFNLNCPTVSLPKLLSWAASSVRLHSLARRTIAAVLNGAAEDALIATLLAHRLGGADVRRCGAVLDGLPRSAAQYDHLLASGLRIDRVSRLPERFVFGTKRTGSASTSASARIAEAADITLDVQEAGPTMLTTLSLLLRGVDVYTMGEGLASLCRVRAFPFEVDRSYHTHAAIEASLSPYKWFCPYSWLLHGDLEDQRTRTPRHGAEFLGKYYFFASDALRRRFLCTPSEVMEAAGRPPLPARLPARVRGNGEAREWPLELLACCPVTLYDTREQRGLRGVVEPVARKGDINCVVEYDGRYYALRDEDTLERFMRRPWQYVAGAALPPTRKQPLQAPHTMKNIPEEEFMRRALYDPIAYALVAVAEVRPKYPGLSLEESALKFIALHMKCFNDRNTPIQAEQYKTNYETFRKRAMLYRSMTEQMEDMSGFMSSELCDEWERAESNEQKVSNFAHLRPVE